MSESQSIESVSWINKVPLNRREKIARWWIERVRQQRTYESKRQHEQEFETRIPVNSIDQLANDGLRKALTDQKMCIESDEGFFIIPRATPDGSEYFGSVAIPRKRLEVRFAAGGLEELGNE